MSGYPPGPGYGSYDPQPPPYGYPPQQPYYPPPPQPGFPPPTVSQPMGGGYYPGQPVQPPPQTIVHEEERRGRPSLFNVDLVELVGKRGMDASFTELSSQFPQIS
ncbi:UNVERIFIED_CONTAM: hypothetical protein NCL1_47414 [Trichonephila clavipes]